MKVFWALIAILVIATVVLVAGNRGGAGGSGPVSPTASPGDSSRRADAELPPRRPAEAQPLATDATERASGASAALTPAVTEQPAPSPVVEPSPQPTAAKEPESKPDAVAVAEPSAQADPTSAPASQPVATKPLEVAVAPSVAVEAPEEENILLKLRREIEAERAAAEAKRGEAPAPQAPEQAVAATGPFGGAHAEERPDGSLLVEGKYLVSGKGTEADPYKVSWDHLISAERDYSPKDGKTTVPERIKALDGKWVEITGYVAFPLVSDETDECLSMMNQWDGCCIGIPPTPYDAIEVRLGSTVTGDTRLTTYGVIKGRFKVDPHLVGGWLVGMYVMDQAKLTPKAYGGVAP